MVMKTLEDERYVVIKAYKCTVSEIWRDSFVLAYIACTSYPYIQSLPTLSLAASPSPPLSARPVKRARGEAARPLDRPGGEGLAARLTDSVIGCILTCMTCRVKGRLLSL